MHIELFGEGEHHVVALHGWGGDHRQFAPMAAKLPKGWRLWSADLPGYGRSLPPPVWSAWTIVDELLDDMVRLGVPSARVVGFCSGAILALLLAQQRPRFVKRLVLIDPFAYVPWYFRIFLWGVIGVHAYRASFSSAYGRRIITAVLRRVQSSNDDFLKAFERLDHNVTLRWLRMLRDLEPVSRFADVGVPITVVRGQHTFKAVRRSVEQFSRMWPSAEVKVLTGVGHLPLVRGAAQLVALVTSD